VKVCTIGASVSMHPMHIASEDNHKDYRSWGLKLQDYKLAFFLDRISPSRQGVMLRGHLENAGYVAGSNVLFSSMLLQTFDGCFQHSIALLQFSIFLNNFIKS